MEARVALTIVLLHLAILLQLRGAHSQRETPYCYSHDEHPYEYFGIATPYDHVRGDFTNATEAPSQCEKVMLWSVIRHGTRYLFPSEVARMKLAKDLKDEAQPGQLCPEDFEAIKNWQWDENNEILAGIMNEQGKRDMESIASRYKAAHKELFVPYSQQDYFFAHTSFNRTAMSCKYFIDTIFGEDVGAHVVLPDSSKFDFAFNSVENCPVHEREVKNGSEIKNVLTNFDKLDAFNEMKNDIAKRLGFNRSLTKSEVVSLYDNCRFEKSQYLDRKSAWCSAFTPDQLKTIEYLIDVYRYYTTGYGHEYNARLGCLPLQHMRNALAEAIADDSRHHPKVVAIFSHDTTINGALTTLGYAKEDRPLTVTEVIPDRKYRCSFTMPFATNIAAVLYKCPSGHKVQLWLNERPLEIDRCPGGLCDWSEDLFPKTCDVEFCNG